MAGNYDQGLVSVTNGSPVVTGNNTQWLTQTPHPERSDTFERVGDGESYLVLSIDADGQLTLSTNYAGASGVDVPYSVLFNEDAYSEDGAQRREGAGAKGDVGNTGPAGPTGPEGPEGPPGSMQPEDILDGRRITVERPGDGTAIISVTPTVVYQGSWSFEETTTPPPGDKAIRINANQLNQVTEIYVDFDTLSGDDASGTLMLLTQGDLLIATNETLGLEQTAVFVVVALPTLEATWVTIPVAYDAGVSTNPGTGDVIAIMWIPQASSGVIGPHISATPPTDPISQPWWFDSEVGRLKVYYSLDSVWVDASAEKGYIKHEHNRLELNGVYRIELYDDGQGGAGGVDLTGDLRATGDGTFFYSDVRLKHILENGCTGALNDVLSWEVIRYTGNELAASHGFDSTKEQLGLSAQSVIANTPEAEALAPFDTDWDGKSVSGENFITLKNRPMLAKLVAAVQQLAARVRELEERD